MKRTVKPTKITRNGIAKKNEAKRKPKHRNLDGKTKMDRDLKTHKN